jgi:anti-anti-sigma regulatory factor
LPVSLKQDGAQSRIRLEGAIDIGCAQELKKLLLQGLKAGSEVRVMLTDVTDLDVTAVQLLWAAKREARASSVGFAFEGQMPEPVSAALAEAGFEAFAATGETN